MGQDCQEDVDEDIENTLTYDRCLRKRQFMSDNLRDFANENGDSRKRRTSEYSFVQDKRLRYDNESESSGNCKYCRQPRKKARLHCFDAEEIPDSNKDEKSMLENEELNIVSDDDDDDEKAQVKLTFYSVYDKKGHLCCFDNDILNDGVPLYAAGYVKPITDDNRDISGGIPMRKIGPIQSWWITGFDGGEKAILGVSTDLADYYLMKPNPKYEPFLKETHQKMFLVKLVIEFLKNTEECDATYDNLLRKLRITVPPTGCDALSEENLLKYADLVYEHVMSYDETADESDRVFVNTPCLRHLAHLAGISFEKRLGNRRFKKSWGKRNNEMTKAATTNLVENVFESFFPEQMDKSFKRLTNDFHTIKQCWVKLSRCDYSYQSDETSEEDDLEKLLEDFKKRDDTSDEIPTPVKEVSVVLEKSYVNSNQNGETSTTKCTYGKPFSIQLESWTEEMIEKYIKENEAKKNKVTRRGKYNFRNSRSPDVRVSFIGDPVLIQDDGHYFREVKVSSLNIEVGDYVAVGEHHEFTNRIGRVIYLWEEDEEKLFHIHWLVNSTKTILGDLGHPQELFETYDCDVIPISMIEKKVEVTYLKIDRSAWIADGNASFDEWQESRKSKDEDCYIYQKLYNSECGRFEDVIEVNLEDKNRTFDQCPFCERTYELELTKKPIVNRNPEFLKSTNEYSYEYVRWRNDEYKVGSFVFLQPGTLFIHEIERKSTKPIKLKDIDEERYPELYRKILTGKRKSNKNEESSEPFEIGYILSIRASTKKPRSSEDISLTVKKLYRPTDTHLDPYVCKRLDLNLLYWSDEEAEVSFSDVEGKCYVENLKNLRCSPDQWTSEGPHRFYFEEAYDSIERRFTVPPTTINRETECEGSGNESNSTRETKDETPISWPSLSKPLRSLDIFAGCGGLTEGLHQAGVADCRWAIEKEETAAHAFRLNYPNAVVLTEDCNELLKLIMKGQTKKDGQALPQKGEVELLCGGPPCQGFSRMNRFNDRQYSCFKNSLVVSFLSYVDYYRPRYVIMENVRNFVIFKNNMMLKLTLRCLIKMGYQCTFGVIQAGHFGVPQSRRRAIILAAAPGEILPNYPEPTTSFEENALSVQIDGRKVCTNVQWGEAAPYRTLKVYDAISDLPVVESGGDPSSVEMSYKSEAKTHFQRMMRKSNDILRDHVSKTVNPLVEKRISFIPKTPDSDWRDLPNIVEQLSDGSYTKKLVYTHRHLKNGNARNGSWRGVCSCHAGKKCDSKYRQNDTLIPWCLPHTGNRNHQWDGLYGRNDWDSHFKTVITNLDPLAKQGKVLHPEQNRILSVRELARSQGFPDKFRFFGNTQDRYRQIGNAVPPPLALALGREIAKAVADVEKRQKKD